MAGDEGGECKLQTVSFGYNDSTLTTDAQSVLKSNAECLVKKKSQVRIEGHCDERGTEEYNLQLGQQARRVREEVPEVAGRGRREDEHHLVWQGAPGRPGPRRGRLGAQPPRRAGHAVASLS